MKWTVVLLIVFGLIAALSTFILMAAVSADDSKSDSIDVVVARQAMPAMSIVSSHQIELKKVSKKGLPGGSFTDPTLVIGRALSADAKEGQVLTNRLFITEGSGMKLASILPAGMRAVSFPVSGRSVVEGLLYPGSIVDVVATFRMRSQKGKGEALSVTLLQGVKILAVGNETMFSSSEEDKKKTGKKIMGSRSSIITVTVMVTSRQAEALQLAMQSGTISLAMRNPLDKRPVDPDATILDQGRLAKLGSLMESSIMANQIDSGTLDITDINNLRAIIDSNGPPEPTEDASGGFGELWRNTMSPYSLKKKSPQWQVTVIKGKDVEEEVLEVSGEESQD